MSSHNFYLSPMNPLIIFFSIVYFSLTFPFLITSLSFPLYSTSLLPPLPCLPHLPYSFTVLSLSLSLSSLPSFTIPSFPSSLSVPPLSLLSTFSQLLPALTCRTDESWPRQIHLVPHEDHRLVCSIVLPPEVRDDVLRLLERGLVRDGVDDDACVRVVRRQTVLHLRGTRRGAGEGWDKEGGRKDSVKQGRITLNAI